MEAILTDPENVQRQIKTRASQLIITNPAVGDINIRFKGENLLLINGVPTAPLPCPDVIRNLMGVATEIKTFIDPVTQQEVTVSVGGIADVIVKCFCDWYREDEAQRAAAEVERQAALAAAEAAEEAARLAAEEAARLAAEEEARLAAEAAANPTP